MTVKEGITHEQEQHIAELVAGHLKEAKVNPWNVFARWIMYVGCPLIVSLQVYIVMEVHGIKEWKAGMDHQSKDQVTKLQISELETKFTGIGGSLRAEFHEQASDIKNQIHAIQRQLDKNLAPASTISGFDRRITVLEEKLKTRQ